MFEFIQLVVWRIYFIEADKRLDCTLKYAYDRANIVASGIIKMFKEFVEQFNFMVLYITTIDEELDEFMYDCWSRIESYNQSITLCDMDTVQKIESDLFEMYSYISYYMDKMYDIKITLNECEKAICEQYRVFNTCKRTSRFEVIVMNKVIEYYDEVTKPFDHLKSNMDDKYHRLKDLLKNIVFMIDNARKITI